MNKKDLIELKLKGLTYQAIADRYGVSRQYIQQLISPPASVKKWLIKKSGGKCQSCGLDIGRHGHAHHKGNGEDSYNKIEELEYLCISCHLSKHRIDIDYPKPEDVANLRCPTCGDKVYRGGFTKSGNNPIHRIQLWRCVKCNRTTLHPNKV